MPELIHKISLQDVLTGVLETDTVLPFPGQRYEIAELEDGTALYAKLLRPTTERRVGAAAFAGDPNASLYGLVCATCTPVHEDGREALDGRWPETLPGLISDMLSIAGGAFFSMLRKMREQDKRWSDRLNRSLNGETSEETPSSKKPLSPETGSGKTDGT